MGILLFLHLISAGIIESLLGVLSPETIVLLGRGLQPTDRRLWASLRSPIVWLAGLSPVSCHPASSPALETVPDRAAD